MAMAINNQKNGTITFTGGTRCLGHPAGAITVAESALLAGKRNKPLEVAFVAAHPEKAVFEATALQVGLELPVNMVGEGFALLGQVAHQGGVVRFDELVEQCLLRLMALAGSFAKAIPALCQHGGSALDLHCAERTRLGQQLEKCHVRSVRKNSCRTSDLAGVRSRQVGQTGEKLGG